MIYQKPYSIYLRGTISELGPAPGGRPPREGRGGRDRACHGGVGV